MCEKSTWFIAAADASCLIMAQPEGAVTVVAAPRTAIEARRVSPTWVPVGFEIVSVVVLPFAEETPTRVIELRCWLAVAGVDSLPLLSTAVTR